MTASAQSRCAHCTCRTDAQEAARDAVIRAARQTVLGMLMDERAVHSWREHWSVLCSSGELTDALQGLRDACYVERKSRTP